MSGTEGATLRVHDGSRARRVRCAMCVTVCASAASFVGLNVETSRSRDLKQYMLLVADSFGTPTSALALCVCAGQGGRAVSTSRRRDVKVSTPGQHNTESCKHDSPSALAAVPQHLLCSVPESAVCIQDNSFSMYLYIYASYLGVQIHTAYTRPSEREQTWRRGASP